MLPHIFPNSSARDTPAVTMSLHAHPTNTRNLTPEQAFESNTGILHAFSSDSPTLTLQYWITTRSILPTFTQDCQESVYDVIHFTPFSTEAAWTRLYPDQPVLNMISARRTETDPPTFPSLDLLISASPTPATPPIHNSPSTHNF